MFKDTFETAAPPARTTAMSHAEQIFWRVVRMDADLARAAEQLKQRGRFEASDGVDANYVSYRFSWNGSPRSFDAQITVNTDAIQIRNFFATCNRGLNGTFEQPNIRPYLRANRRPL